MSEGDIEWSSDQMIDNAGNWSLEGDVAILNHLKKFSQSLLSETEALDLKVGNLLNQLEHTGLKLELTKNQFHSLRNSQFIENRVYEDDETVEHEDNLKVQPKEPTDEEKEQSLKNAVANGLKVMEKYFDKVEVVISDSEGEDNERSHVLKPKDPYIDRPLPYLIGSEEWHQKWHVGLLPSDTESESEKEADLYSSSSDSETYLPKNHVLGSETSSELEFVNPHSGGPVANSTFNHSKNSNRDMFHSSDEEESSEQNTSVPNSNQNFAEQLAAKLGDVISGRREVSNAQDKVVQPPTSQQNFAGNLFSDQPPPLEDQDETVLPKAAHQGLFAGGRDLFSENPSSASLWNVDDSLDSQKSAILKSSSKAKPSKGLFSDSDSSSEEDMLAVTEKRKLQTSGKSVNPYMARPKTNLPFLDEQPPEISPRPESELPKKKPIGGVSIFGDNPNIFAPKTSTVKPEKNTSAEAASGDQIDKPARSEQPKSKKPLSLFDNSSDEEAEMFLSNKKSSQVTADESHKKSIIFDDSDDFDQKPPQTLKQEPSKTVKKISLFDDDDDDFLKEEEELFSTLTKKKSPLDRLDKKPTRGLFDDLEDSLDDKPPSGLFNDLVPAEKDSKVEASVNKSISEAVPKVKVGASKGLFDDLETSEGDDDDFFKEKPTVATSEVVEAAPPAESRISESVPAMKLEASKLFDDLETSEGDEDGLFGVKAVEAKPAASSVVVQAAPAQPPDSSVGAAPDSVKYENPEIFEQIDARPVAPTTFTSSESPEFTPKEKETAIGKDLGLFEDSEIDKSPEEDLFRKSSQMSVPQKHVSFDDESVSPKNVGTEKEQLDREAKVQEETKSVDGETSSRIESSSVQAPRDSPPAINVFDPTPPPVEWDASSDNSGESDRRSLTDEILDRTSYHQPQPTASSIFDEAPPSLDMNYSSGIVKDVNATRIEGDDSSFYPYASSSRRLSSDLFADQQSQDSFFVTKNSTDNAAQVANLEQISESAEGESKIEFLTASGKEEDFGETSSSVFANVDAVDKPEDMKPPQETAKRPSAILQRASLFDSPPKEQEAPKPKPPTRTSPGKLKHNLNINVGALLPGVTPFKTRNLLEKSSSDETDDSSKVPPEEVVKRPAKLPAARPKSEMFSSRSVDSGSFDEVHDTDVLQSVTKDRAKIPIKRRPSTRRARQEAVRNSMTDFSLHKELKPDFLNEETDKTAPQKQIVNKAGAKFVDVHESGLSPTKMQSTSGHIDEKSLKRDASQEKPTKELRKSVTIPESLPSDSPFKGTVPHLEEIPKEKLHKVTKGDSLFGGSDDDLFSRKPLEVPETRPIKEEFSRKFTSESLPNQTPLKETEVKPPQQEVTPKEKLKRATLDDTLFGENDDDLFSRKPLNVATQPAKEEPLAESLSSSLNKTEVKSSPLEEAPKKVTPVDNLFAANDLFDHTHNKTKTNFEGSDLFKPGAIPRKAQEETKHQSSSNTDNLFDSPSSEDEDLFSKKTKSTATASRPVSVEKAPVQTQRSKTGLFSDKSDSDSDDGLFGGKTKLSKTVPVLAKGNLFDDSGESSEDDLFGAKTIKRNASGVGIQGAATRTKKPEIKTANVKKLENKEVTDFDPLSDFI